MHPALATALGLLALSAPAFAQAGPIDRWGGFKEGSWVKARIIHEVNGKKQEVETTRTVSQIQAEQITLSVENAPGGKPALFRMRRDLLSAIGSANSVVVEQKDGAAEEIVIGSKPLKCSVHEIKWKSAKDAKAVDSLKLWESDQAPGRLVRAEGTWHDAGVKDPKAWKHSGKLTSLDEKLTVAGKDYACSVFESTASGPGSWDDKVWISKEAPGLILRSLGHRDDGSKKETTEWTVLEFEVKK